MLHPVKVEADLHGAERVVEFWSPAIDAEPVALVMTKSRSAGPTRHW